MGAFSSLGLSRWQTESKQRRLSLECARDQSLIRTSGSQPRHQLTQGNAEGVGLRAGCVEQQQMAHRVDPALLALDLVERDPLQLAKEASDAILSIKLDNKARVVNSAPERLVLDVRCCSTPADGYSR